MDSKNLKLDLSVKIGMRVIKTALAVTICLYISLLLKFETPIFACVAAITSMKSSFSESFDDMKRRMFSAVFGVILGIAFSYIPAPDYIRPILGGLGIVIMIYILQVFGMRDMILLSCLVFVSGLTTTSDRLLYGFNRIFGTFLGLLVGAVINYLISSPNVYNDFMDSARDTLHETKSFILKIVSCTEHDLNTINSFTNSYNKSVKAYKLVLSELNTPVHVKFDLKTAKNIMHIYNDMNIRFNLLNSFETYPYIYNTNKRLIGRIFSFELMYEGNLDGELNSVFNYHLHRILEDIIKLENLIGEIDE